MATKKATKAPAAHPKYAEMIAAAVTALKNPKGSSMVAISTYIKANYKVGDRHQSSLKASLLRELKKGSLVKKSGLGCAGSFKLAKVAAPKKKVVAKKPAAKKAATPKKKAAPKKKTAAKSTPKKKKATTPKKKAAPKKAAPKKAAPKKAAKKAAPKKAAPKKAKK